jgi:alpha-beta hydrolase superfamily lysophospholipase
LRSTRSHFSRGYSEVSDHADLVLDTTQIGRWAPSLGGQVSDVPVPDARHDVFLSIPDSRAQAYAALDAWLAGHHLVTA